MSEFLGIGRESLFSPGKVESDRSILEAVADALRGRGHGVRVVSGEAVPPRPADRTTVFTMSQGERAIAELRQWERHGIRVVNSVESILGCHRHRLVERLRRAQVATPESVPLGACEASNEAWPDWLAADGGWLKRGDVHATEPDDVVFVESPAAATAAAARLRARGIERFVLQRHVEGIVIKFYAVGETLIAAYPPRPGRWPLGCEDEAGLRRLARDAGRALGLEVYGGDVVTDEDGRLQLVDLNDWPSYATCRAVAAEAIAAHLEGLADSSDR